MKCPLVYQAGISFWKAGFEAEDFLKKLILADKSRLKKLMIFSAFIPASMFR